MPDAIEEIRYPEGYELDDILGWGSFGLVLRKPDSSEVVKTAHANFSEEYIAMEKLVYERIEEHGGHPNFPRYYGSLPFTLRLEYAALGDLREFIDKNAFSDVDRWRWTLQIAQALEFIHQLSILHGDLKCDNIFLSEVRQAKMGDFSSSYIATNDFSRGENRSYVSVEKDIFGYGSVLYEIFTGSIAFADIDDPQDNTWSEEDLPDTNVTGSIRDVILKCWLKEYLKILPRSFVTFKILFSLQLSAGVRTIILDSRCI